VTCGVAHTVHIEDIPVEGGLANPDPALASSPQLVDVSKQQLDATLAVPPTARLTLGAGYDTQHFQGAYGATFSSAIDARKNQYLGNLTYQLNNKAAITFSARQSKYQDTFVPTFNFTQTQANLNYTVKF